MLVAGDRLSRIGDRDALVCEGRRLSYRDLADLVHRVGPALRACGTAAGERVVLRLRDTELLVGAFFGAMLAGRVPVVLGLHVCGEDLRHVVEETRAALVVEEEDPGAGPVASPAAKSVRAAEFAAMLRAATPGAGRDAAARAGEAFWLFSSGTTGRMKGVIHAHHDLAPVVAYHRDVLGMGPGTRIFCTSRLSFAYALGNACLAPLALGATVVLHPDWPTPQSSLETLRSARPEIVFSVPSLYRAWLGLVDESLEPMRRVRRFVSAGEALPPAIAERWRALTGQAICDCYGCSETVFFVFATPAERAKPGSVGVPCAGVETELRDETDRPVEPGQSGRLFVCHPFTALGYGPASAHAQGRFRDGWFATGDMFRRDPEGYWFHCGREDDWLKIAGRWVNLRDLEETAGAIEGVGQAVAVAAPDADGFMRVALFVVALDGADQGAVAQAVGAFLAERLPPFERPKWIRVVGDLPCTATGKVRKAELRRMVARQEG